MAFAVRSLRAGLRSCSRQPTVARGIAPPRTILYARRALSSTPTRRADDDKDSKSQPADGSAAEETPAPAAKASKPAADNPELRKSLKTDVVPNEVQGLMSQRKSLKSTPSKSQRQAEARMLQTYENQSNFTSEQKAIFDELEKEIDLLDNAITEATAVPKKMKKETFWGEDEEDPDMLVEDIDDEEPADDDIMSMAHGKLEEFREYREYARVAAWQMPLLASQLPPNCFSPFELVFIWATADFSFPQSLHGNSSLPPLSSACGSDTRPTWARSTRRPARWWSSSRRAICP